MRANPGGELGLDEVVGRDSLIRGLWRTLELQSVVLIAERRIGKTSVIKKMVAECPEGRVALFRDVEGLDTPSAFAERVYHDLEEYLALREEPPVERGGFSKRSQESRLAASSSYPLLSQPIGKFCWRRLLRIWWSTEGARQFCSGTNCR